MALASKKNQGKSPSQQQFIRINPYEVHENVLQLMSQISAARPSGNTKLFYDSIDDVIWTGDHSLDDFIETHRDELSDIDFMENLEDKLLNLSIELQTRENTNHTQIVVAGGFSSGKSSFLNKLVGDGNLLPTGVQPVSVVPTYLYCSAQNAETEVKGVNLKNAVVSLPKEVLQAIQHSNNSNIHIASVLEKLFVEVSAAQLNNIVFIDTPGYNNSMKKNDCNGRTDDETTRISLKEGQALIWLVDSEKGTTIKDDLDIIKGFNGPKLIVFHKADKKGHQESREIVESEGQKLRDFLGNDLIDVIAYSSLEEKLYASYYKHSSLYEIFEVIKKNIGQGNSGRSKIISEIADMFDDEISTSNELCKELEADRRAAVEEKRKATLEQVESDENYSNFNETIREVTQSYVDIKASLNEFTNLSSKTLNAFLTFYNGVMKFENEDHWGHSNILSNAIDRAQKIYTQLCNSYNREIKRDFNIYEEEYIKEDFTNILISYNEFFKENYGKEQVKEAEDRCQQIRKDLQEEHNLASSLEAYKAKLISAIYKGIEMYEQSNKTNHQVKEKTSFDVFKSISEGNLADLVFAMSNDATQRSGIETAKGYDLSKCNSEGYTLLTYAVHCGQLEIVKFMLEHEADPSSPDGRGYNAFLTAVEQQNKTLCELILSYDPDLVDSTTNAGETAEDLMEKNTFSNWLTNKL